jgi:hypothetical protein
MDKHDNVINVIINLPFRGRFIQPIDGHFGDGWIIGFNALVFLFWLQMSLLKAHQNRQLGLGGIQYLHGTLYVTMLASDNTIPVVCVA